MAKIADMNCKKIYITDDNPRNEQPGKIRQEIFKTIKNKNCFNIGDRSKAIKTAIKNAEPNEVILIAGKGHEAEQIYKNKIISISDKKIVNNFKSKIKKFSKKNLTFLQNKLILKDIKKGVKIDKFHGLAIDSRVVKKNNLFLTIKGKNNNGVKFIPKALKKGATKIISTKKIKKYKNRIIKVNSEMTFLNNFASKKREKTHAKILAITGSAGKTSLKNLIKDLLQNFGETLCSPKSYNNHYGVPLSLSYLKTNHKFGVFEVGMSKAGEINKLTKLIKPHIGIITNIGEAHIENFKNISGIANAKSEIIKNIQKSGTIILNRDDKFFNLFLKKAKKQNLKVVSFGKSRKSDVCLISTTKKKNKVKLMVKAKNQILKLEIKNINIYNVLSSIALIIELKLDLKRIVKIFKNYEPTEGRGRIHDIIRYKKKFKLIDESYNANPLSVKNAINSFNSIKKNNSKKYLLLGDMLELGEKSEKLHEDLSKVINNSDIDKVFIKGVKTLNTYKNIKVNKRGNIFQQDEDVDFTLNNIIANNDYLMIKGSNATGLNKFSKKLIKGN
jgi:murE/murF fusion protein